MVRIFVVGTLLSALIFAYFFMRPVWVPMYQKVAGKQTVNDVIEAYQGPAQKRLEPYFQSAGVAYPPRSLTLLAIKDSDQLELWASDGDAKTYIRSYPILAASGIVGPKLHEGDKQVPEGIYQLEYLNPNSAFHLSMKLNYPNAFDLKYAAEEGRTEPGTNIFIHGKAVSIGCLAMGDEVIEELFVLTSLIGKDAVDVAIAPSDPRTTDIQALANNQPEWVSSLYSDLSIFFADYQRSE